MQSPSMTPVSIVLRDSGVFTIRPIQSERELEVDAVVAMVNRCYRSTENWTNENAILEGVRICRDSLKYNAKQFDIFVVEDPESKAIVGCIKTGLTQDTVVAKLPESVGCIGLFAVSPDFQSRGLGSRIMRFAENFCREKGARRMVSLKNFFATPEVLCLQLTQKPLSYKGSRSFERTE